MDVILEHVDPQVVFVIIALLIGGGQALLELIRKRRAENEARRELADRGEERTRRWERERQPRPVQDPFEDLYEEYRRTILEDQRRVPGEDESHVPPWQAPAAPPPLPPAAAPPKTPPVLASVDPEPEPWIEPAVRPSQAWQAPPPAKLSPPALTAAEQAALAAVRAGRATVTTQHVGDVLPPSKRLATRREDWRRAILLREVLGPPKALGDA